jgi:hypothetical protein
MLEIIACPQCGVPAEIAERFWLDSTDGTIQHLQTICVSKHWLTPRADMVDQQWPPIRSPLGSAAELAGPGAVAGAGQHRR